MKNRLMMAQRLGLNLADPAEPGGDPAPNPSILAPLVQPVTTHTLTQEQVNAIAAAEAAKGERKGRQAAEEALAQRLGGASIDDLLAAHKATQDAADAQKSEAQKALDEATKARAAAEADRAAAKSERFAATVERALSSAGVDGKAISAITVPGVTVDSTPEEIEAAVTKLKADVPALFGTQAPGRTPPRADPQVRPGLAAPASGSLGAEGMKRFEERYGQPAQA